MLNIFRLCVGTPSSICFVRAAPTPSPKLNPRRKSGDSFKRKPGWDYCVGNAHPRCIYTCFSRSRRQLPTQRSATPFGQGLSKELRTHLVYIDRIAAGTPVPYLASRSKIRNRGADPYGKASRSCWTTHRLVGCRVTWKYRMRRGS